MVKNLEKSHQEKPITNKDKRNFQILANRLTNLQEEISALKKTKGKGDNSRIKLKSTLLLQLCDAISYQKQFQAPKKQNAFMRWISKSSRYSNLENAITSSLKCLGKSQTDLTLEVGSRITPRLFFDSSSNVEIIDKHDILSTRVAKDFKEAFLVAQKINTYEREFKALSRLSDNFKLSKLEDLAIKLVKCGTILAKCLKSRASINNRRYLSLLGYGSKKMQTSLEEVEGKVMQNVGNLKLESQLLFYNKLMAEKDSNNQSITLKDLELEQLKVHGHLKALNCVSLRDALCKTRDYDVECRINSVQSEVARKIIQGQYDMCKNSKKDTYEAIDMFLQAIGSTNIKSKINLKTSDHSKFKKGVSKISESSKYSSIHLRKINSKSRSKSIEL
jgi:hypothetical protein